MGEGQALAALGKEKIRVFLNLKRQIKETKCCINHKQECGGETD